MYGVVCSISVFYISILVISIIVSMMVGLSADVSVQTHRKIKKRKKEKEKLLIAGSPSKVKELRETLLFISSDPLFLFLFFFPFCSLSLSLYLFLSPFFLSPIPHSVLVLQLLLFFRATLYSTSGSWPSLPQTHRIRSVEAQNQSFLSISKSNPFIL